MMCSFVHIDDMFSQSVADASQLCVQIAKAGNLQEINELTSVYTFVLKPGTLLLVL